MINNNLLYNIAIHTLTFLVGWYLYIDSYRGVNPFIRSSTRSFVLLSHFCLTFCTYTNFIKLSQCLRNTKMIYINFGPPISLLRLNVFWNFYRKHMLSYPRTTVHIWSVSTRITLYMKIINISQNFRHMMTFCTLCFVFSYDNLHLKIKNIFLEQSLSCVFTISK